MSCGGMSLAEGPDLDKPPSPKARSALLILKSVSESLGKEL